MAAGPDVETLLDEIVPTWMHRTVHGRDVAASPERVAQAIRETTLDEARVASILVAIRTRGASRGMRAPFVRTGDFEPGFVALGETPLEVCLGFIGRPWPGGAPERPVADAEAFRRAEALDSVKVATSIRCARGLRDAARHGDADRRRAARRAPVRDVLAPRRPGLGHRPPLAAARDRAARRDGDAVVTIAEALDAFDAEVVAALSFTPQSAYRRTTRLLRHELGDRCAAPLDDLGADDLRAFIAWHRAHGLTDDAAGTRKAAVHVARLGDFLAERCGRADLAIPRDELRALAPDDEATPA
jgi:hypothetical protein